MRSTLIAGDRVVAVAPDDTVHDTLRRSGVPLASSCDGDGICGRCTVQVVEGDPAPPTADELRVLSANRAEPGHRLACRLDASKVRRVDAPYWPRPYPHRVQGS